MRPYQTIVLLVIITLVILLIVKKEPQPDLQVEQFINCYIDISILHYSSDSSNVEWRRARDSILDIYDFNDSSFIAMKDELDQDPQKLSEVWSKIEEKLDSLKKTVELKP